MNVWKKIKLGTLIYEEYNSGNHIKISGNYIVTNFMSYNALRPLHKCNYPKDALLGFNKENPDLQFIGSYNFDIPGIMFDTRCITEFQDKKELLQTLLSKIKDEKNEFEILEKKILEDFNKLS